MPRVGISFGTRNIKWEDALVESVAGTLPYPVPLLMAFMDERNDQTPSASSLALCLRQFELKKTTPYYEKSGGLLPSTFGTAFHKLMESYSAQHEPGLREQYLSAVVDTGYPPPYDRVEMRGTLDYLNPGVLLRDWKTKVNISETFTPPDEHKSQVHIYNWLAVENGLQGAPMYELAYASQMYAYRHRDTMGPVDRTARWVRRRLTEWAAAKTSGTLPPVLPSRDNADPKQQGPCRYCPVRAACESASKIEGPRPF